MSNTDRDESREDAIPAALIHGNGALRRGLLGPGDSSVLRLEGVRWTRG